MARDSCLARVGAGVAVGGAVGGAVVFGLVRGRMYGCIVAKIMKVKRKARLLNCADFRVVEDSSSIGLLSIVFRNLGLNIPENDIWLPHSWIVGSCIKLVEMQRIIIAGAVYGTFDAVRNKIPGLLKIRHIGQTTVGSAAIFGLFLGCGSLIHCGKSY
uniref:Uncharacterized protein n=1 Tax=Chenopodium quinoa TaxID=63459 RepID=A0A803MYA6_CHEQI